MYHPGAGDIAPQHLAVVDLAGPNGTTEEKSVLSSAVILSPPLVDSAAEQPWVLLEGLHAGPGEPSVAASSHLGAEIGSERCPSLPEVSNDNRTPSHSALSDVSSCERQDIDDLFAKLDSPRPQLRASLVGSAAVRYNPGGSARGVLRARCV